MVQYVQSIRFRVCGNIIDCHVGGAELDGVECTTVAWRVHEANIIWCGLSVCVCVCVCVCVRGYVSEVVLPAGVTCVVTCLTQPSTLHQTQR